MVWFWDWHENKFIKKMRQGIVLYKKPKNECNKSFENKIVNRRLQTKRVETHTKK